MKIDNEIALLFGIMLGDGCLSLHVNKKGQKFCFISISGNYYDDRPFYNSVVLPLINSLRNGKNPVRLKERKKYGKIEINFTDKDLFEILKNLKFPVGKKGNRLRIPEIFYDKNFMRFIVQGFFATDGSVVLTKNPNKLYPRLEAHGIAPKLISQVQDYLLSLGMDGKFYECKRKKRDFRWKTFQTQYRFQFNGTKNLLIFEKEIGFINPKQFDKFSKFLRYSEKYDEKMRGIPTQKQKFFRSKVKL